MSTALLAAVLVACLSICNDAAGIGSESAAGSLARAVLQKATSSISVIIKGKLVLIPWHDGTTQYFLSETATAAAEPRSFIKLPGPPVDRRSNSTVAVGSQVTLECGVIEGNTCEAMSAADVSVVQGSGGGVTRADGGKETVNLLVAVLHVADDAPCRPTVGRHTMGFRDVTASFGAAANLISLCSKGKKAVNVNWVVNVTLKGACSYFPTSWCNWQSEIAQATSQALACQHGDKTYSHVAMVLPADVNPCGTLEAAGMIGGIETYFTSSARGKGAWSAPTIAQELLHNVGLWHGSRDSGGGDDICVCEQRCTPAQKTACCQGSPCTHTEYGDSSTCMGSGEACPSAPEQHLLGWASPLATLTQDNLPPGSPQTFNLLPLSTYERSLVVVRPTWMQPYQRDVYLSTRAASGGDMYIEEQYTQAVSVHLMDKEAMDSTYPDNPDIHLLRTIPRGTSHHLSTFHLYITVGMPTPGGFLPITTCRYERDVAECLPRPPPTQPSPPPPPTQVRMPPSPSSSKRPQPSKKNASTKKSKPSPKRTTSPSTTSHMAPLGLPTPPSKHAPPYLFGALSTQRQVLLEGARAFSNGDTALRQRATRAWAPDTDECTAWYGVQCVGGLVVAISTEKPLQRNRLMGTLPQLWSALTSLISLDLSENAITGSLPPQWSTLTQLTALQLHKNKLTGTLPPQWSTLIGLYSLDLSNNHVAGSLPAPWSMLAKTHGMHLHGNALLGTFPPQWSALGGVLAELHLYNNAFSGTLPAQWSALTGLTELYLQNNSVSGSLPEQWSALGRLTELQLHYNSVSDSLPVQWSALTNVRYVELHNNALSGSLPAQWSTLAHINGMYLDRNKLSGNLPKQWSDLNGLTELHLYNNTLSGSLPVHWSALTSMHYLELHNNALTGTLPLQWSTLELIHELWLYGNKLPTKAPPQWSHLNGVRLR